MSIYYQPTRLGDYANSAASYASQAFPSAWSPDVGLTSNAYGMYDPSSMSYRPYTAQDVINQGGGDPNSIINVPHGQDFLAQWGWTIPFLGAAGAALAAPAAGGAAAAGAGGGAAGAGAAGAGATDLGATDLAGVGAGGMAAGGLTGGAAGAGAAGAAGAAGGSMATDVVPSFDQIVANAQSAPMLSTAGSPADMFTAGGITTGNSAFDSMLSGLGSGMGSSLFSGMSNVGNGLSSLGGGSNTGSGGNVWSALGNIGSGSLSLLPGLLALNYARNTSGIDTSGLSSILGKLGGNQDAVVKAATDPLQQNIAAGYGDLVQSQAARGIRGSSFGDTDIANYLSTTGTSLANAGANAMQGSLALQGNLAGEIANLKNQSQLQKNALYGNAFDVLGRALNPAGYAGSINLGGMGTTGFTPTGSANTLSGVGQLVSGLGSLGSTLYNMF